MSNNNTENFRLYSFMKSYTKETHPIVFEKIPNGDYCYYYKKDNETGKDIFYRCPYWDLDEKKEKQNNGYCHLLKIGDWFSDHSSFCLWDSLKECGINNND